MTDNFDENNSSEFSKILYNYMRAVEDERHQRLSISWFARHFGIKQNSLSLYLLGQAEPNEDNLRKIAEKTGPVVYDALGRPRPMPDDPLLRFVVANWSEMTPEQQQRILKIMEERGEQPGQEQSATTNQA